MDNSVSDNSGSEKKLIYITYPFEEDEASVAPVATGAAEDVDGDGTVNWSEA